MKEINGFCKLIGTGILAACGIFLHYDNAHSKQYEIHPLEIITYPLGVCSGIKEFRDRFGERQRAELVPTIEFVTPISREEAGLPNSDLGEESRQSDSGLESGGEN